jgi:hypothetical protein
MDALAAGHDAAVQMIDTSVVRVHQQGACIADNNHQDANYLAFVKLASIRIWLRANESTPFLFKMPGVGFGHEIDDGADLRGQ